MTTATDIIAILRGIDANPHDWRARALILADTFRDMGRYLVADALEHYADTPNTISAGGLALLRTICCCYRITLDDRRFVSRLIRESA